MTNLQLRSSQPGEPTIEIEISCFHNGNMPIRSRTRSISLQSEESVTQSQA
jgi:hypothetical protein